MVQRASDRGAVADTMPAERMLLLLGRSPQQSASLEAFLAALQDKSAPEYRRYLSPEQFAALFGPSELDVQAVTAWLREEGFQVDKVSAGRQAVEFSGTAGQVRHTFHTEIHSYAVGGEQHFAIATPPEIPSALAPAVRGLLAGNFGPRPQLRWKGTALLDRTSHRASPLFTSPSFASPMFNDPLQEYGCLSGYCFAVTPGDFATIYDTKPLLAGGTDGTGIAIGIVGDAPVDLPSAQAYRQNFLPAYSATNLPVPILEGPAPTLYGSDDEIEAQLDVEEAGGVAPNATIDFYYGGSNYVSDGVTLGLLRAIDDNQVSILSNSFGGCESYFGDTYDAFFNNLYQQAAAQGITVVAAAGDSGSAACDPPPGTYGGTQAVGGLAVNGLASTLYNVAVGGTDFYYPANATAGILDSYWNATSSTSPNNNPDWSSAKEYIPEKPWNISDVTLNQVGGFQAFAAGGGGKSSCVVSTGATPNVCISGYPQPSWQVGFSQDNVRDVPDVSLFASDGGNYSFTAFCLPGECASTNGGPNSTSAPLVVAEIGGTSVSAPAFAGILALAEQAAGSRLGQANAVLYALAKQQPSAFHDIAVGTNRVQCGIGTPNCGSNGYLTGYSAAAGYDLATGLGSVDAAVLVSHWDDVTPQATTTTLSVSPTTAVHGTNVAFTVNVTGGATGGSIALLTTASGNGPQGQYVTACAAFPCTFAYAGLPGGAYTVAARFAGDATHQASTSPSVPVTIAPQNSEVEIYGAVGDLLVNGALTQTTNLNGQTLVFGALLEFTALPLPAGTPPPSNPFLLPAPATGTLSVQDNGVAVATQTLNAQGNATFNLSTLPVGQHSLVVAYSGDGSYAPSNSTAPLATPMSFAVAQAPTQVSLFTGALAVPPNTPVTLTAFVYSYDYAAVTGSVAVQVTNSSGTSTLPAAPLSYSALIGEPSATVTIPASALATGKNVVSVTYGGNASLLASVPATVTVQVIPANTTLTIMATPTAPVANSALSVVATLDWQAAPGNLALSGTVEIMMDGTSQCFDSLYVTGGSIDSDCQFLNMQPGTHTVTAVYTGDATYTPASASFTFTVPGTVPVNFGLTATPVMLPSKTVNPSGSSTISVQLANMSSSPAMFNLSCSTTGAPAGMSCNLPSSLTVASGSTLATATATISLAGTTAAAEPYSVFGRTLVGFALLPAFLLLRRKGWQPAAVLCLLLVATFGVCSCGSAVAASGSGPGTAQQPLTAGTYAVTVTAQSGATTETATILVRVQ